MVGIPVRQGSQGVIGVRFPIFVLWLNLFFVSISYSFVMLLDERYSITATFGENRGLRLHAGIDIGCEQRIGIPVRSAFDGYIFRMKCDLYGYGKALYIRNKKDKKIVVYAHLWNFENKELKLEDKLESIRKILDKRYKIDYIFPKGKEIFVKKGQIIGFTGSTGNGGTHLHFEVRNDINTPINPLKYMKKITWDKVSPFIESLVIIPMSSDSIINGLPIPYECFFKENEENFFLNYGEISLSPGKYRFLLNVFDRENSGRYRLGVYTLDMKIDNKRIAKFKFDRFSYKDSHLGLIYPEFYNTYKTFYYNVNLPTDFSLAGVCMYTTNEVEITNSPVLLKVSVGDYYGNISEAEIRFSRFSKDLKRNYIKDYYILDNFLVYNSSFKIKPSGESIRYINGFKVVELDMKRVYRLYNKTKEVFVFNFGTLDEVKYKEIFINNLKDSTYNNFWCGILQGNLKTKLKKISNIYYFKNTYSLLKEPVKIGFIYNGKLSREKIGIYSLKKNNRIKCHKTLRKNDYFYITTRSLNNYFLGFDNFKPDIYLDKNYNTICITDYGSGVNAYSIKCFLNKKMIDYYFDTETGELYFNKDNFSKISNNDTFEITVIAFDNVGNKSKRMFRLKKGEVKLGVIP